MIKFYEENKNFEFRERLYSKIDAIVDNNKEKCKVLLINNNIDLFKQYIYCLSLFFPSYTMFNILESMEGDLDTLFNIIVFDRSYVRFYKYVERRLNEEEVFVSIIAKNSNSVLSLRDTYFRQIATIFRNIVTRLYNELRVSKYHRKKEHLENFSSLLTFFEKREDSSYAATYREFDYQVKKHTSEHENLLSHYSA